MFKDRIYENLWTEFGKYGISEDDIDFITEFIHYKTENVDRKYKDKAFLFQVCKFVLDFCHE